MGFELMQHQQSKFRSTSELFKQFEDYFLTCIYNNFGLRQKYKTIILYRIGCSKSN